MGQVASYLGRACPKVERAVQVFILGLPHTIVHCRKGKVLQQSRCPQTVPGVYLLSANTHSDGKAR